MDLVGLLGRVPTCMYVLVRVPPKAGGAGRRGELLSLGALGGGCLSKPCPVQAHPRAGG